MIPKYFNFEEGTSEVTFHKIKDKNNIVKILDKHLFFPTKLEKVVYVFELFTCVLIKFTNGDRINTRK